MKPTGGGPQVTPVPPPNSLFPGITAGLNSQGSKLGSTLSTTLQNITSGMDMNKIYDAIKASYDQSTASGTASIEEQFGATGAAGGSGIMDAISTFRTNQSKQMSSDIAKAGFEGASLQLGGAQLLENLATSFAPSVAVTQAPAGASIFSQASSAGESAMMLYLLAGSGGH